MCVQKQRTRADAPSAGRRRLSYRGAPRAFRLTLPIVTRCAIAKLCLGTSFAAHQVQTARGKEGCKADVANWALRIPLGTPGCLRSLLPRRSCTTACERHVHLLYFAACCLLRCASCWCARHWAGPARSCCCARARACTQFKAYTQSVGLSLAVKSAASIRLAFARPEHGDATPRHLRSTHFSARAESQRTPTRAFTVSLTSHCWWFTA